MLNWFTHLRATCTRWLDAVSERRKARQLRKHRRWLRRNGVILPRADGAHLPKPDYRRWSDPYMKSIRRERK